MKNLICLLLCFSFLLPFGAKGQTAQLINQRGGTHNYQMEVDGLLRQFLVHFPANYDPSGDQLFPVVFMLHGGGGSGKKYYNISGWKELGEQEGIVTVFPTAYEVCFVDRMGQTKKGNYWLTTDKSEQLCSGQKDHSDANFLRAIADYLKANHQTDTRRFYCTGFSNGMGTTMTRVIPQLSDVFAAVGGTGSMTLDELSTPNPMPCLMMVSSHDPKLIQHNGGQPFPTTVEGIEQNELLTQVMANMCQLLQLELSYEAAEKKKHTSFVFEKPLNGGNQKLQFTILKGLKHVYPRGIPEHNNIEAAKIFWDFFQEYQL
ncbi:MAG TPA: PHB depolymerase family esterase [Saprospiraceae bacterium]|nr:PHB depolymerase family esterase [Saprospiraceae bacterium]